MRAGRRDDRVIVVLSKRNLLALLAKVDDTDSAKTIIRDCRGEFDGGMALVLQVEPDEVHYKDRKPGLMHPKTEGFIAGIEGVLEV